MKKAIIFLLIIAAIAGAALYTLDNRATDTDYIRVHIRADSNDYADQQVKLAVRDKLVEFLIPRLATATTKSEAQKTIGSSLAEIATLADGVLSSHGFNYRARARMTTESFPARQYGDFVMQAGVYDALIIELGSGAGDNWWCVAYPPLCFVPSEGAEVVYKSKILEIIEKFKHKNG